MFAQTIASRLEGERPVVVVERDEDFAVQAEREGHLVVRIGEQIYESTARRAGADIVVVVVPEVTSGDDVADGLTGAE